MALNNQNVSYRCDGTSALAPEYPALTLIQGGKSKVAASSPAVESKRNVFSVKDIAVLVAIALVACALCVARDRFISANIANALENVQTTVVTVHDGDTLWGLAQNYSVSGVSTKDLVEWIESENNLDNANIRAGQALVVPSSVQ